MILLELYSPVEVVVGDTVVVEELDPVNKNYNINAK